MQLKALYSSWHNKIITTDVFNNKIYPFKSKITKNKENENYILYQIYQPWIIIWINYI